MRPTETLEPGMIVQVKPGQGRWSLCLAVVVEVLPDAVFVSIALPRYNPIGVRFKHFRYADIVSLGVRAPYVRGSVPASEDTNT